MLERKGCGQDWLLREAVSSGTVIRDKAAKGNLMSEEFNFETVVRRLADEDAQRVGGTLGALQEQPLGDSRIMSYLEKLLDDTRLCITQIKPYRYGEIRWLAGAALAAERKVHGIDDPVRIKDSFPPITQQEVYDLAIASGISLHKKTGLDLLKLLIGQGKIRTANRIFFPRGDFGLSLRDKHNTEE
jgi:hypothetical protein